MNKAALNLEGSNKKVIKRDDQRLDSVFFGRVLKHQVLNAEERANEILLRANESADVLRAEAEAEVKHIRDQAYESGRDEAMRELLEDVLAAKEQRSRALFEIEGDVLRLAIKIAEKIIGREVAADENVRGEMVLTALRQARQQEMLTVRINANDLPLIERMRDQIDAFRQARYIDFVVDQAVADGGCMIESPSGTIDARLGTQLRILENALLAQVKNE